MTSNEFNQLLNGVSLRFKNDDVAEDYAATHTLPSLLFCRRFLCLAVLLLSLSTCYHYFLVGKLDLQQPRSGQALAGDWPRKRLLNELPLHHVSLDNTTLGKHSRVITPVNHGQSMAGPFLSVPLQTSGKVQPVANARMHRSAAVEANSAVAARRSKERHKVGEWLHSLTESPLVLRTKVGSEILGKAKPTARRGIVAHAPKNVDLPEVVFFDEKLLFSADVINLANANSLVGKREDVDRTFADTISPHVPDDTAVQFAADCRAAGALIATASTVGPITAEIVSSAINADASFFGASKLQLFKRALSELVVQPRGFGDAPPPPQRPPERKWCVALEVTPEGALAAKKLGMRALGVGNNNYAAHAQVETLAGVIAEDIATPGAFWINPLEPPEEEAKVDDDGEGSGFSTEIDDELAAVTAFLEDLDPATMQKTMEFIEMLEESQGGPYNPDADSKDWFYDDDERLKRKFEQPPGT
eukprot:gnl/MRDRNA2_/MRDRNA2_69770_c0_seq1.p1 gnl/MRDRNA2_/MRDRNA2_69770_c0~~gnl/MRDRNA2_/MRDRNA2_69770_c0_seq1.p1  ORF type:complete len:474 (-),score=104.67 gnl/MRDRNA2_/MRDRNA2_69770_c0_seq1:128-1549(-)